jgi:excisionase family DNA binding protein
MPGNILRAFFISVIFVEGLMIMPDNKYSQLRTIEEAANLFNLRRRTAYRWALYGKLPTVIVGGKTFVDVSAVKEIPEPLPRGRYQKRG